MMIFQVHIRTHLNCNIPLIIFSVKFEETWKMIRNVIFNQILDHATLSRECASAFKAGFYDLIIRPMLKLCERNHSIIADDQHTHTIKEAITNAMATWRGFEINMTPNIQRAVARVISGKD